MKHKLLAIILVTVLSLLAFVSCKECEHPLLEEWESDDNGHWHPTECEHGEFRSETEPHVDENEDEKCDECGHKVKHQHTFASDWTIAEDKHWKEATCTHTDIKGDEGAHVDEQQDAVCDVCGGHVHVLDGAGFCHACNKEIIPIDESSIGSVLSAATARTHNVISSDVNYYQISRLATGVGEIRHRVEYFFGTNGMHSRRSYNQVDVNGNATDKTEVLDKWIEIVSPTAVKGIATVSVDGAIIDAYPSDYVLDDLLGDYYAVSSLADGYGAEALLLSVYRAYEEFGIGDSEIVHDADANSYEFDFNALVVKEYLVVNDKDEYETVYTADYYEVSLSFTYADDYTLKSFDLTCDCWTSDAGDANTDAGKAEIDIEYYPETNTFKFVQYDAESDTFIPATDRPRADTYTVSGTQTIGTREEIEIDDGSQYKPTSFEIYTDKQLTTPLGSSITVCTDNMEDVLYVSVGPEGTFLSFFKHEFEVIVTDENGNASYGFTASLTGDQIFLLPFLPGDYNVTFKALGIEYSADVSVTNPAPLGEHTMEVEVLDSYSWSDEWNNEEGVYFEFIATKFGEYTFYLPPHLAMAEKNKFDKYGSIDFDFTGRLYDPLEATVTVSLIPNQVYRFYVMGAAIGTYTISYDTP